MSGHNSHKPLSTSAHPKLTIPLRVHLNWACNYKLHMIKPQSFPFN